MYKKPETRVQELQEIVRCAVSDLFVTIQHPGLLPWHDFGATLVETA